MITFHPAEVKHSGTRIHNPPDSQDSRYRAILVGGGGVVIMVTVANLEPIQTQAIWEVSARVTLCCF